MNRPLFIIFAIVALDAIGIGLIFPILPALLQDVIHSSNTALYMGILASLYAAMQFVFSPLLGALSDRLGRKPVLLLSLAGAAINYLFLSFSHGLVWLLLGRMLAGISSANMAVASAYIADVSTESNRARNFGLLSAMFGAGFIVGPVLGGVLGEYWIRLPFLAAALFSALNAVLAYVALPAPVNRPVEHTHAITLNPFKVFVSIGSMHGVLPLIATFFILSATGEAYAVCWALWGHDAFQWNAWWIGMSLGTFGICQLLVQSFMPAYAAKLLGDRHAVLVGIACTCTALLVMAFARHGWIIFAVMPIFALGSIGTPALQALASQKVPAIQQGQFQGVIASTISLSAMLAPLLFSVLYFQFQANWPGAIWLAVVLIYLLALPVIMHSTKVAAR